MNGVQNFFINTILQLSTNNYCASYTSSRNIHKIIYFYIQIIITIIIIIIIIIIQYFLTTIIIIINELSFS